LESCRKCGTPNPKTNQYCKSCGAVLNVATAMVRAQPRTLMPFRERFRWRWVFLGALVMLGIGAFAVVGIGIAGAVLLGAAATGSLTDIGSRAPGFAAAAGGVFLLAFALGGFAVAKMSKGRTVAEPAVASLMVLALIGATSMALSPDALVAAAILALPGALAAAAGGWFGEVSSKDGGAP